MDKAFKNRTKEHFFELREKLDGRPEARDEMMHALRRAAVINSTAIDLACTDPMLLQLAPDRIPDRKWAAISPVYQSAMLETQAMLAACARLEDVAVTKHALNVPCLLQFHKVVFERTQYSSAGKFRTSNDLASITGHDVPHHSKVQELVEHHLSWLTHRLKIFSEVTRDNFMEMFHISAEGLYRFACTLPFEQGNGRMAQALGDYILLYTGLYYNVISFDERDEYFHAIKKSSIDGLAPLVNFLIRCFAKSLRRIDGFSGLARTSGQQACRTSL